MTTLQVRPFILWWIAFFDMAAGPIGAGPSADDAKANLIVCIAHKQPTHLKKALGELANVNDLRRAIRQIQQLRHRCEIKASEHSLAPTQVHYQQAANHWQKVIERLSALMVEVTP